MQSKELKKNLLRECPFCGGEAKIIIKDWDNKVDEYKVVCTKCGASMEDYYFNEESAIRLWNNRVTEAEIRASVIDEFAEKLHDLCGVEIGEYQYTDLLHESRIDEIADQLKEHSRKLNRCDTCNHYVADEVPPICYFCCKGMEDNYQQKGE